MDTMASQITSLTIVYLTVHSGADQRKHQSSASLAFCAGNPPETGKFPAQMASNAENVSIWWRHHVLSPPQIEHYRELSLMTKKYRVTWASWHFTTPAIFNILFKLTTKGNIKVRYHWHFMWKAFPCHDIIMETAGSKCCIWQTII